MSNLLIKKISVENSTRTSTTVYDIGSEAQNVKVSFDENNNVIEDITAPGVVIDHINSVAKTVKDINNAINNKINSSDLEDYPLLENGKVPMSELPTYVKEVIEGYYNTTDNKFYKDSSYTTEIAGEISKFYIDLNTNSVYRWSGSVFIEIFVLTDIGLENLNDVSINNPADGQSLVYDDASQKWTNKDTLITFIPKPGISGSTTFTYDGTEQGPTIINKPDSSIVTIEHEKERNAGSYTLRFKIRDTQRYMWDDLTTADVEYSYVINQAEGSITLSSYDDIILDADRLTATVNVINATGDISVSSSDTGIATVNYSNRVITITAKEETGNCTVTVNVTGDNNHNATSVNINVNADFINALKFSSDENFTLSVREYPGWNNIIEYSIDRGITWLEWDGSELNGTILQPIYLRGIGNIHLASYNDPEGTRFVFTGKYITGNIETLLDYQTVANGEHPTMSAYCYKEIFMYCRSLIIPPKLPATTLTYECYDLMFSDCTSLTILPKLPAITLPSICYAGMFRNCTNIKLSTTQGGIYQYPYRIPTSGTGTMESSSLNDMFKNTGGTFTGKPEINTTYYTDHEPV